MSAGGCRKQADAQTLALIKQNISKMAVSNIASILGISAWSVRRMARSAGIYIPTRSERAVSCDLRYFDTWSKDMAYVFGFCFADGSVDKHSYALSIQLSKQDESVITFIRNQLRVVKTPTQCPSRGTTKESVLLRANGKILVNKLKSMGLSYRKTFRNDPFPEVPQEFIPHFIRGVFDGDGKVTVQTRNGNKKVNTCRVGFIGTPKFLQGVVDHLHNLAGMTCKPLTVESGKEATWATVCWTRPRDLAAFRQFIYPEGFGFCLERKYSKLCKWLDDPNRIEMSRHVSWVD